MASLSLKSNKLSNHKVTWPLSFHQSYRDIIQFKTEHEQATASGSHYWFAAHTTEDIWTTEWSTESMSSPIQSPIKNFSLQKTMCVYSGIDQSSLCMSEQLVETNPLKEEMGVMTDRFFLTWFLTGYFHPIRRLHIMLPMTWGIYFKEYTWVSRLF